MVSVLVPTFPETVRLLPPLTLILPLASAGTAIPSLPVKDTTVGDPEPVSTMSSLSVNGLNLNGIVASRSLKASQSFQIIYITNTCKLRDLSS